MPHDQEWELAEEICKTLSGGNGALCSSGTEVTHARVPHRARRDEPGQDLKFEGSYHGLHDNRARHVKPKAEDYGDPDGPQFRSRWWWRAQGFARECCRRQLQQSEECPKTALSSIPARSLPSFSSLF